MFKPGKKSYTNFINSKLIRILSRNRIRVRILQTESADPEKWDRIRNTSEDVEKLRIDR